jgi:hypothetical protein
MHFVSDQMPASGSAKGAQGRGTIEPNDKHGGRVFSANPITYCRTESAVMRLRGIAPKCAFKGLSRSSSV